MGDPQIYVRGFPKYTSEEDLKSAFSSFGEIKEVRMIRDYAFIVSLKKFRFLILKNRFTKLLTKWTEKISTILESEFKSQDNPKNLKVLSLTTNAVSAEEKGIGNHFFIQEERLSWLEKGSWQRQVLYEIMKKKKKEKKSFKFIRFKFWIILISQEKEVPFFEFQENQKT